MSQDAIAGLDATIDKLESELSADPRFVLLTTLRRARDEFGASTGGAIAAPIDEERPIITAIKKKTATEPKLAPGRAKAYRICKEALVGHTEPVRTRDLYNLIEANGVDLPGGMNNLSSMLGRHPTVFKSHSRAGWTLKDQENGAEPNSAANGDDSAPSFATNQEGGESREATTHH